MFLFWTKHCDLTGTLRCLFSARNRKKINNYFVSQAKQRITFLFLNLGCRSNVSQNPLSVNCTGASAVHSRFVLIKYLQTWFISPSNQNRESAPFIDFQCEVDVRLCVFVRWRLVSGSLPLTGWRHIRPRRRAWGSINFSGCPVITKVNADIWGSVLFWLTAYQRM